MKSVPNSFKVPKRQWRKWSQRARYVFNELYSSMFRNQQLFKAPSAPMQKGNAWKTTCWNSAWIAADAVRDFDKSALGVLRKNCVVVDQRGREVEVRPSAAALLH